jgi:hypothetical protein
MERIGQVLAHGQRRIERVELEQWRLRRRASAGSRACRCGYRLRSCREPRRARSSSCRIRTGPEGSRLRRRRRRGRSLSPPSGRRRPWSSLGALSSTWRPTA